MYACMHVCMHVCVCTCVHAYALRHIAASLGEARVTSSLLCAAPVSRSAGLGRWKIGPAPDDDCAGVRQAGHCAPIITAGGPAMCVYIYMHMHIYTYMYIYAAADPDRSTGGRPVRTTMLQGVRRMVPTPPLSGDFCILTRSPCTAASSWTEGPLVA